MENNKNNLDIIIPLTKCYKNCGNRGEVRMFSGRWVCNKCLNKSQLSTKKKTK